jgi:hypothetical protein
MNEIPSLSTKELKQFGLILGLFIILVFGFFIPWLWGFASLPNYYFIALGITTSIFALLFPSKVIYIYNPYMRFALALGQVINSIILGILFFVFFAFTSLLLKILRIDLLNGKYKNTENTYRIYSDIPSKSHFERPF